MSKNRARNTDVSGAAAGELWAIGRKVRGLALLLEQYGLADDEQAGFHGIGLVLSELGNEISELADQIDADSARKSR